MNNLDAYTKEDLVRIIAAYYCKPKIQKKLEYFKVNGSEMGPFEWHLHIEPIWEILMEHGYLDSKKRMKMKKIRQELYGRYAKKPVLFCTTD